MNTGSRYSTLRQDYIERFLYLLGSRAELKKRGNKLLQGRQRLSPIRFLCKPDQSDWITGCVLSSFWCEIKATRTL